MAHFIDASSLEQSYRLMSGRKGQVACRLGWSGDHVRLLPPSGIPLQVVEFVTLVALSIPRSRLERLVGGEARLNVWAQPHSRVDDNVIFHYDDDGSVGSGGHDTGATFFIRAVSTSGAPCGTLFDRSGRFWGETSPSTAEELANPVLTNGDIDQVPNSRMGCFTYGDCHSIPSMQGLGKPDDLRGVMFVGLYPRAGAELS